MKVYAYGCCVLWMALFTSLNTSFHLMHHSPMPMDNQAILPRLLSFPSAPADLQVLPTDSIMLRKWDEDWDNSPIVVQEFKLLFFTIPKVSCTLWKQLFRRIQGLPDWKKQNHTYYLPHNPEFNGLTYLNQFNTSYAKQIFDDPSWTKAIFVRDPKERFLSAYLDKVVSNNGVFVRDKCCNPRINPNTNQPECLDHYCFSCVQRAMSGIPGFLEIMETCHDAHWEAISHRLESKYWNYINFVGTMKHLRQDGEDLLKRIGAWEKYGKSGWGPDGTSSMFDRKTKTGQSHTTDAKSKVWQYYTPEVEKLVEQHYDEDYRLFHFPKIVLTSTPEQQHLFVQPSDSVWNQNDWDQSPVVVEKYKLIFFTIPRAGAAVWKKAFRRMEGFANWQSDDIVHDPSRNGLTYLHMLGLERASEIMTSPEWTRAIFVRNPKDRFMSVYSQYKRSDPEQLKRLCCPLEGGCERASQSLKRFVDLIQDCRASHWNPQSDRMEEKYWKHIDFIGHVENSPYDAKKLLKRIGAWDEIGNSGWGEDGTGRIFATTGREYDTVLSVMAEYNPSQDRLVEAFYEKDYENERFQFSRIPNVLMRQQH
eukprot:scaffold2220_cov75-Cylindrotheca_fusiformis.AAC.8